MKKLILLSTLTFLFVACGNKVSDKANEICNCVEENQNSTSDAMATMEAMDKCTKDRNKLVEGFTSEEKSEFTIKVNDCLKEACKNKGMNYEIGVQ